MINVRRMRHTSCRGCESIRSPSVRDYKKTIHPTDVLIVMLTSKYEILSSCPRRCNVPRINAISSRIYMDICTCVHTRVTSSSHELGVKEGFIFFYRAQHASFTYITTYAYNNNIKILLGVSSDVGERALWRVYNYVRDTTGSYFVCVRGSYIHVYVYKFVSMYVSMVRHYVCSRCADRSRLNRSGSKQASDKCEGEDENFTRLSLTSGHRAYPPQWTLCTSDTLLRESFISFFFFLQRYDAETEEDTHLSMTHVCLRVRAADLMKSIIKCQSIFRSR